MYLGAGTSDVMCPSTAYGTCNVQDHAYIPKRTLVPVHIMHCCVLIFVLLFAFLKICFVLSYLVPIFTSVHHCWSNIIYFFSGFLGHSWECKPSNVFERYFGPISFELLNCLPCCIKWCSLCTLYLPFLQGVFCDVMWQERFLWSASFLECLIWSWD